MTQVSFRGGSRIGWVNASWPLARLTATADLLTLSSFGTYQLSPSDVVALEPYGSIPLLASGIRIRHNRLDCPENIVFWCMGNRDKVLAELTAVGFLPKGTAAQRPSGFPVRWVVILAVIVLWNVLFLLDRATAAGQSSAPGPLVVLAVLLLLVGTSCVRASSRVQRLVLRDGHTVGEIRGVLVMIQIVSGVLLTGLGGMLLAQGVGG